ncbi:hypothetical protein DFH08DRAFT_1088959 [Mycena albidolilacea]|uniref:Uncharacterized protein n=1 Tax=Mycena albidolilacea TaxID=1033008 RepID=A0AAD7E9V3_9AGAR|nr:hypothetical protein DFH08DRAFT_1088959 [Mycena albidolilacea]
MSSLSSYIKRQSRVIRRSTLSTGLTSILEDEPALEFTKNNSTKAERRHGVSDLAIPHTSPLFTAVQRTPCLDSDYECPRPCPPLPRCDSPSSESEGSRSGSASPVSSGLPTTPTPSPTAEGYDVAAELKGQAVIRCKTIKPLAIVKRAVSPVPPQQPVASTSALPLNSSEAECQLDQDAWQDDDEYCAAHAGSFITLAPPLPPSFPAPPSCEFLPMSAALPSSRALRRESAIIPTPLICRSPAVRASIPTRVPPSPPIVTSSAHCRSYTLAVTPTSPALSRSRTRAPPKTPLQTDALSTPWSGDWTAYAPFGTPSPSSQHSYDLSSACSSSSERLATLLSPSPQRRFPAETQGVPSDVSSSEWEEEEEAWEACAVSYGDAYEDVPLSPLLACVPSSPSSSSSPLSPSPTEEKWSFPVSPLPRPNPAFAASAPVAGLGPGRYTGWHPHPPARVAVEAGVGGGAPFPFPFPSCIPGPFPLFPLSLLRPGTRTAAAVPARTRTRDVSSSRGAPLALVLLHTGPPPHSSVHSAHAHGVTSPKTFAFVRAAGVRRYMHFPKSPSASKSSPSFAKGCGQKTKPKPMGSASVLSTTKRGKGKGGKRVTVEDVCVISPAPAPAPPASTSPAPFPATPTPTYRASTPHQRWLYSSRASSSRASSSESESDSGHSDSDDCGSECSEGSIGMRRKPIPVGLFLR